MASNLWNIQSPTKRIDLCFKIDDYKKHLLQLKNVKSTFKKSASTSGLMRGNGLDRFQLSRLGKCLLKQGKFNEEDQERNFHSSRTHTQEPQSSRVYKSLPKPIQSQNLSIRLNSSFFSPSQSPNSKYKKFRDRQINQQNKMILKKLQTVKASPELTMKRLFQKYSTTDLKYRTNLQRCRYKHVDFNKQAERLIKGEKIKFSKIKMETMLVGKENNEKICDMSLDWRMQRTKFIQRTSQSRFSQVPCR